MLSGFSPAKMRRRQPGRLHALGLEAGQAAADDPVAEVGAKMPVDGGVRRRGESVYDLRRDERLALAVLHDVEIIDDAPTREAGEDFQQVVHRESGQVDELQIPLVAAKCLPRLRDPVGIRHRLARHDGDAAGARMEPQGHVERRLQVHPHRDARDARAEPPSLHLPTVNRAVDDGDARKDSIAIFQHEIQRRRERGDDDVDLPAGVFLREEVRQPPLMAFVREARRVEILVIDLDRFSGRGLERRTEALIEPDVPRMPVARRVEHHNPPGARGIGGRGTGDEAQDRCRPDSPRDAKPSRFTPLLRPAGGAHVIPHA